MIKRVGQRYRYHGAGFTIIEMLLVVSIIALVAGASGVMYFGTYKRMLVEKAAREVLLAAKYARVIAVEKQASCRLMLDKTNNSFLLTAPGSDSQAQDGREVITNHYSKPRQFAGDVRFEEIQITSRALYTDAESENVVVFRPNGTADMSVLQIGDGKNHCTVYISAATGKGRIEPGEAMETGLEVFDLDAEQW
ncbi:MAG TPA: prepilin-type N-terminal cleavage/methylation domain-containing protein [Planctomycetes bacterium]|nr:prepilin-type N-terminal cleavage/methylation domain-containing protein [Planctomycetota bacterium]HIJ70490.1 prepilin-type N-terminal cleavage/methylation domain-containing protein [Planctomycetota bacterium]